MSYIQSVTNTTATGTAAAAITPTAGNVLVVAGFSNTAGTAVTISDTGGHTWTQEVNAAMSGNQGRIGIWYTFGAHGSATTVSVTGAGNNGHIMIVELSSAGTGVDPFDGISAVASGTTGATVTTNSVTTTNATDTLVGIFHSAGTTFTAAAGWSNPISVTSSVVGSMEFQDVTSTGTYTATATVDGNNWQIYLLALKTAPPALNYTAAPADQLYAGDLLSEVPPDGLTATVVSLTEIDLSWSRIAGAVGYDLQRNGVVIATGLTALSYQDTGLTQGTTYTYNIRSVY